MKKILSLILCMLLFVTPLSPSVLASDNTEYFEDGSYIVEDFLQKDGFEDLDAEETTSSLITKIINLFKRILELIFGKKIESPSPVKTKSATKYAEYYDKNGNLLWTVYLTGYFSYDGVTAKCTDSSVSYKISDDDWKMLSMDNIEEENTAKGSFTLKQYKLGVPLKTIERKLNITCDKNGKLN